MKLTMFAQLGRNGRRALWGGAVAGLMLAAGATAIGDVTPEGRRLRNAQRDAFSLFAGPTAILAGNQLQCGIDNQGNVCVDVFNSPTGGGGFWPAGSPNAYIFNTGLQIAGLIPVDAGFEWAGDTTAAYFFDARGSQQHSAPLEALYDSQNTDDLANWPLEAYISNPDLFQPVLLGRKTASQQDSWTKYWDGDPLRNSNRQHPMGIEVTQRSLAWNYPAGNEVVIYFIYDFTNVTNTQDFQVPNELQFFGGENALPDGGWQYDDFYASFSTDMDVTSNATQNFSTAILPFDMGLSYHGGFNDQTFIYSPSLFFPPFFTASPGIVGVKYLKSPIDPNTGNPVGLTLFSNTQNPSTAGAQFVDPFGDRQLWRYLSGNLDPAQGDPPCNVLPTTPDDRTICFVFQQASDTRFYQASGPFSLPAGEVGTIVVAYIVAATLATLPNGDPTGIVANAPSANANPPGFPSFHPGFPSQSGCDANGSNCVVSLSAAQNAVNPIEAGSGWIQYTGPAPSSALETAETKLDQFQVEVMPNSLLGRALVAQTIFDNKFLLGFSPEVPPFWLVPGDNSVTVVWNVSATERDGDPFYEVASEPTSSLFNPNYREFDVEGYRIWKGEDKNDLTLLAQFDYTETQFVDTICETVESGDAVGTQAIDQAGNQVTVNGFATGELCAGSTIVNPIQSIDPALVFNNGGAGGNPGAGVVRLNNLEAAEIKMDTVVISDKGEPSLVLSNTGVPFVFADNAVINNFTYWYAVSAFDVNSAASGPISLRSVRQATQTVPRDNSPEVELAQFESSMSGDDGVPLVAGPIPSLDPSSGVWAGPMPPSNALISGFAPLVERLLPQFALSIRIDSVQVRQSGNIASGTQEFEPSATCTVIPDQGARLASPFGACWVMYMTINDDGVESPFELPGFNAWWQSFGGSGFVPLPEVSVAVPFDPDALAQFGIPSGSGNATVNITTNQGINMSAAPGPQSRRFGYMNTGARWFDGSSAEGSVNTIEDPAKFRRAGHVAAADTIFSVKSHNMTSAGVGDATSNGISFEKQCANRGWAFVDRAADVVWEWDGSGSFSSVRDVTHNVDVSYHPAVGPTWGFLTTDANGNGVIDWHDFNYIETGIDIVRAVDGGSCNLANGTAFDPTGTATAVQLVQTASLVPTSTEGMDIIVDLEAGAPLPQTGVGFGLFVHGHRYIFEMTALPAGGTVWTHRSFNGATSASNEGSDDPSGYAYVVDPGESTFNGRQVMLPGLQFNYVVPQPTAPSGTIDLTQIHTVPDPYLATSAYDLAPTTKQMMFVNLPVRATLRIYSLTGILVRVLEHDDSTGGGRMVYDVRNRNNQFLASGVYFFHVITPEGFEYVGKFTIVNSAGQN